MPGGRVLNPQSYHSAFRISSTRHEGAIAGQEVYITITSLATGKTTGLFAPGESLTWCQLPPQAFIVKAW